MFRRGVLLLIALGFVAGQLAAVPHAHADDDHHERHSARPHVHLDWLGGGHHEHEYHHHHVAHREAHLPAVDAVAHDHDDDAVYLSPVVPAGSTANESHLGPLKWQAPTLWQWFDGSANQPAAAVLSFAWRQSPPNSTVGHCALFLTLQTLQTLQI